MPKSKTTIKTKHPGVYRRGDKYLYTLPSGRAPARWGTAASLDEARRAKRQAEADVDRGELVDLPSVRFGAHRPHIEYPPTKVHVFASETFGLGREPQAGDDGGKFWIYSPERAITDAMRLPHLVGRGRALGALRRYLATPNARPAEVLELGRRLRVGHQMHDALDVLLS